MSDAAPRRNHWLWSGTLVALLGFVSYYTVFFQWPATRDFPWVNLPLVWAGAGMTAWGMRAAIARGGWRIAAGGLGALVAFGLAALLTFYCFVFSYRMPAPTERSDVGATLPDVTLVAHDGTPVSLRQASGGKLVIAFYRGAW